MGLTSRWTHGVPPAGATLDCSGETHRLLWQDGELLALDHDDPEAERALAALGGTSCACVEMLDAWGRHASDPRVLVLGPRGGEGSAGGDSGGAATGRRRLIYNRAATMTSSSVMVASGASLTGSLTSGSMPSEADGDPLDRLLTLGGAIPKRLVATVAAALTDESEKPEMRAQLHAALFGRVLAGLTVWFGEPPQLQLEMIPDGAEPSLQRRDDLICARFPFRWLIQVWARELTTVWGHFVLTATPDRKSGGFDLGCVDPTLQVSAYRLAPAPSASESDSTSHV